MNLINGTVIRYPYDAVVIGAGLSGLVASAYLCKAGAKVLVCEQAPKVGGLFNSFTLNGYHFDGGIKAVENSGMMLPTLGQFGLLERIQFEDTSIALITGGRVQPIRSYADVENYFTLLGALFPEEQAGLARIKQDTKTIFDLLSGLLSFPVPLSDQKLEKAVLGDWFKANKQALGKFTGILGFFKKSLHPYLQEHLKNEDLVNLMSGLFPDGTSAFFGLGYFAVFLDYHYPVGGIHMIPNALANYVREQGSGIRVNTPVRQIVLKQGRACGVELESGEQVFAGKVISAADLKRTLTVLSDPGLLPARFLAKMQQADVSHSVFNVYIGLDMPVEALNFEGCHHVFYNPELAGISEDDRFHREDYFLHVPQEIAVPCMTQPALAPAGKTGLNLSAMTNWEYLGGWDKEPAEYARIKDLYARQMITSLERYIPHLSEHIEFFQAATPRSVFTRSRNSQGAIMGWSYNRTRTFNRVSLLQIRSTVLTPIPNLLTAGHWSFTPGGSPIAVLTGRLVADAVIKNLPAEEE
jgi:phytoene dehydrogenase-like protein